MIIILIMIVVNRLLLLSQLCMCVCVCVCVCVDPARLFPESLFLVMTDLQSAEAKETHGDTHSAHTLYMKSE